MRLSFTFLIKITKFYIFYCTFSLYFYRVTLYANPTLRIHVKYESKALALILKLLYFTL